MNVLSSLGNFTIGKLHTGTYHMFPKQKKKPNSKQQKNPHISPPQKPAALLLPGCIAPSLRGNEPQASFCSIALHCVFCVQCKNEIKGKWNPEIKSRRGKICEIKGAERCWEAKWQGCGVPPGSVTWQMAQNLLFYYKQITCNGWIIHPGQPSASDSLALSGKELFFSSSHFLLLLLPV